MADKLRVHTLSKELGVPSKVIVQKCKLEGVEGITNHMSTVSAGLAETLREWFSEESHGTAVETAAPVDLEKVRVKAAARRKKKAEAEAAEKKKAAEAAEAAEAEAAAKAAESAEQAPAPVQEAVAETEGEAEPAKAPAEAVSEPLSAAAEAEAAPVAEVAPPAEEPKAEPEAPAPGVAAEEKVTAEAEEKAPAAQAAASARKKAKAKPVKPAGPQNVPAPAQMKGPNIIGFAKPDPIFRPVPRAPRAAGAPEAVGSDGLPTRRGTTTPGRGRTGKEEDARNARNRANPRRSRGSLVEVGERLREWNDRDLLERQERLQGATGRGIHARRARERQTGQRVAIPRGRKTKAEITEPIIVNDLCAATGIGLNQLFPKFKNEHNLIVNRNSIIPSDIAQTVLLDFGMELVVNKPKTALDKLQEEFAGYERKNIKPRPPVVTMLGHVDHGKTSLLDAIRQTSVQAGEAGGITQHIGAYTVKHGDLAVTFLDTPGHEAFTAMRARGAHMTDVVVLVVAADDGVMPQTAEAINHAKAAKVPIVIALNKIDLPGTDLNKVYGQLAEMDLTPTEWSGDTDVIKTSATTGQGIDDLVAHLAMLSELLDFKADVSIPARGAVVEANMQMGVGPVARVLVQEGTLKRGDFLVSGPASGRVRRLRDDKGKVIKSAGPGIPVEVTGLDAVPNAGDSFYCVKTLQQAKDVAGQIAEQRHQEQLFQLQKPKTLDDLFAQRESGAIPELNLIIRADVQGSVDALLKMLGEIPSTEVKLNILHTGIGGVSESDVVLAMASNAMVVGFNVSAETAVQRYADREGVDIRLYRVIYELVDDIRRALEGLLSPDQNEEFRGRAEVREAFRVSKVGIIAGCIVSEGVITRSNMVRIIRDGQIIVPTTDDVKRNRHRPIASLRRFKDDAREVRAGMECGIRVDNFDDVKSGDIIEAYELIETARTLG